MQLWQVIVAAGIILANLLVGWSIYRWGWKAGKRTVKIRTGLGPIDMELGSRILLTKALDEDPTAYRVKCLTWNDVGGFEITLEDERRRRPNTW